MSARGLTRTTLPRLALCALILALSTAPTLLRIPVRGTPAAPGQPRPRALIASSLYSDFDGDQLLDRVEISWAGVEGDIEVRLSGSASRHLNLGPRARIHGGLLAADIDSDSDLDLIWLPLSGAKAALVWLGDGRGHFEIAKDAGLFTPALDSLLVDWSGYTIGQGSSEVCPACISGFSPLSDQAAVYRLDLGRRGCLAIANRGTSGMLDFRIEGASERGPPVSLC